MADGEVHALVFPCRRNGMSWVDAERGGRLRSIQPTGGNGPRNPRVLKSRISGRHARALGLGVQTLAQGLIPIVTACISIAALRSFLRPAEPHNSAPTLSSICVRMSRPSMTFSTTRKAPLPPLRLSQSRPMARFSLVSSTPAPARRAPLYSTTARSAYQRDGEGIQSTDALPGFQQVRETG